MQNCIKSGTKLCTSTGTVTVLASDLPNVLAVETSDTTVCFYLSPHIEGNVLRSVQTLSFTVKKAEFYAVLETAVQNGNVSPEDTHALVGSLREIYYCVPTALARLVVQAFQQDRQYKAESIGGDI
ncbi:MAG: hypothetical protein ACI4LB_01020 [Candidatus Fimenecus sp.]